MLRTVAALALEPLSLFEFAIGAEVFGIDRTAEGAPGFEFRVCAADPGRPVRTKHAAAIALLPSHGLEGLRGADLVIIGATDPGDVAPDSAVIQALRTAYDEGAILLSMCSGAFTLAATGLLDGRQCATHWMYGAELARRHPAVTVDDNSLFVDEGRLVTSAGTAAGIDACLHVVRRELGASVATYIARRMVVPPQREGGQRQYVDRPVPPCAADSLAPLLDWLAEHLDGEHSAESMAAHAHLSPRTFARRFAAETGTTPHQWLSHQRVAAARHLLEASDLSIEQVASRVGFGSPVVLRTHFRRVIGTSPTAYRARFAC
ncbi:MAG: helix-turn-helix domain-containing protein [Austwickia sp.]|jgi:AraC family transcriptional activator FtrA|nr:MAG: helix-turn-helix domain-containing protein [Austwickia sp.]